MKFSFDRNTYGSFFEEAGYNIDSDALWVVTKELSPTMEVFEFVPVGELTINMRLCLNRYRAKLQREGGDIVLIVPDQLHPEYARSRVELVHNDECGVRTLRLTLMYN